MNLNINFKCSNIFFTQCAGIRGLGLLIRDKVRFTWQLRLAWLPKHWYRWWFLHAFKPNRRFDATGFNAFSSCFLEILVLGFVVGIWRACSSWLLTFFARCMVWIGKRQADLREVWVSIVLLSFWTWRKSRLERSAKPCCVRLQLQPRFLLTKNYCLGFFLQKTTALGSSYSENNSLGFYYQSQKTTVSGSLDRKQWSRVLSTGNNGFWFYFR